MNEQDELLQQRFEEALCELVFLGFNSRVCALNRNTGELAWQWKSPQGKSSYVAVLLDGDRLIVSVQGYTYCLNPLNGEQVWGNALSGFGLGVPSLASVNGTSMPSAAAAQALAEQARRAASHGAAVQ